MSIRLSGDFYHRTLGRFEQFANDPLVFPILLGFLKKAAQSKDSLQGAKAVIGDIDEFRVFFNKTRTSLSPSQALLIQEQEAEIRAKLKSEVEAEIRREAHQNPLEIELRIRKEYDAEAAKEQKNSTSLIVETIVASNMNTISEIGEIKKKYEADSKADKKHRNIAYTVSAVSLAIGVFGVAVSWPGVMDELTGHKSDTGNNGTLQVRFASSGQCAPSDVRVEVKKDGVSALPSKGVVCLDVTGDATPPPSQPEKNPLIPLSLLPYGGLGHPNTGKSMLDLLNEGKTVLLNGKSICLKMPKPIPCIGAEVPTPPPQKGASIPKGKRPPDIDKREQYYRHHCP